MNALTHRLSTLMKQIYRCGKLYFFKKAQERRTGNIWMFHLLNPNIGSSGNSWLNSVEDISHTKSELQLRMTSGSPTCDSIWKRGRKRRRNIYTKCPLREGHSSNRHSLQMDVEPATIQLHALNIQTTGCSEYWTRKYYLDCKFLVSTNTYWVWDGVLDLSCFKKQIHFPRPCANNVSGYTGYILYYTVLYVC